MQAPPCAHLAQLDPSRLCQVGEKVWDRGHEGNLASLHSPKSSRAVEPECEKTINIQISVLPSTLNVVSTAFSIEAISSFLSPGQTKHNQVVVKMNGCREVINLNTIGPSAYGGSPGNMSK